MTNYQFHSIMMMFDMVMSLQVKDNKFWTWFWMGAAVYDLLLALLWRWVLS